MDYTMTKPCPQCPFLKEHSRAYPLKRLKQFAEGSFPCHKTAESVDDGDGSSQYEAKSDSAHCAGALIFNEKRGYSNQMMRIAERLGIYDARKLDMTAEVR